MRRGNDGTILIEARRLLLDCEHHQVLFGYIIGLVPIDLIRSFTGMVTYASWNG